MAAKREAVSDGVAPWERQDGEGDAPWQAFVVYRGLGLDRTYAATAAACRKHVSLIQRWSLALDWRTRTVAWDREIDRVRIQSHKQALREMDRRHGEVAAMLISRVKKRIERLSDEDMEQLSPRDLAKWLSVAVEVERRSRGAELILRAHHAHVRLDDEDDAFMLQHMNLDDIRSLTETGR